MSRDAKASAVGSIVSVVVPAHNESAGILHAIGALREVLSGCNVQYEIVVVDDGSRDETFSVVAGQAALDPRIRGLRLSRNFGKESAILAGIMAARGNAVITIDADLQHPPSVIPFMIEEWRKGARVVHAVKRSRATDGPLRRWRAAVVNAVISRLGGVRLDDSSDFKLLDRVVVDVLSRQIPERRRFYRGLADWVGYRSVEVPFDVAERVAGEGKWSLRGLIELTLTALVSFTTAPLRIVIYLGAVTLVLGLAIGVEALASWYRGDAVSGFSTTILTLLIIGSSIMLSLGIIGEYIAKIYEEVKARPVYLIEDDTTREGPL